MRNCFVFLISINLTTSFILNQCYSSGNVCIRFVNSAELTKPNATFFANNDVWLGSNISRSFVFSDLFETNEHSGKANSTEHNIGALVVNVGERNSLQWKITPDRQSEHPIELYNKQLVDSQFAAETKNKCFDFLKNTNIPDKILVAPPNYAFFYTVQKSNVSILCSSESLTLVPFKWNKNTRAGVQGISYFSFVNCNQQCQDFPIQPQIVQLCPTANEFKKEIKTNCVDDFSVQLTDDLFGVLIRTINRKIKFPVGIIDCTTFIKNIADIGVNAICLGDGAHLTIKFEENPNFNFASEMHNLFSSFRAVVIPPNNPVHPIFTVSYPTEVGKCMNQIQYEIKRISGNGLSTLNFQWIVLNGSQTMISKANLTNDRILKFSRDELLPFNKLIVIGCNIAGRCTTSEPLITKLVNDLSVFHASIEGYEKEAPTSFGLRLHAQPSFQYCNMSILPKEVQYEWKINGENKSFDDSIKLPAHEFEIGQYVNITLTAKYNGEKCYSSKETKIIHYVGLPLSITLNCCQKKVAYNSDLLINANAIDQNYKNSNLKYSWDCEYVKKQSDEKCNLSNMFWDKASIKIPAEKLPKNKKINFTVTATSDDNSGKSWCVVSVGNDSLPNILFFQLSKKKQNIDDYIRILALVKSSYNKINITWDIAQDSNYAYFNISSVVTNPTTIIKNIPNNSQLVVSLTIPPFGKTNYKKVELLAGQAFIVRLWATDEDGTSFSDLLIQTNSPPTLGIIDMFPTLSDEKRGIETSVMFSVGNGWNDDKDDFPLSYQFGYRTYFLNGSSDEYWFPKSTAKSYSSYFSSASKTLNSSCSSRIGYKALLSVCDRLESCTTGESPVFEVLQPKNLTVAVSEMILIINSNILNGNYLSAINKIHMLNEELCTQSFDQKLIDQVTLLLFESLSKSSDGTEYYEALSTLSTVINSVSSEILSNFINILSEYRKINYGSTKNDSSRSKRSLSGDKAMKVYQATETEATDMLKMYDILISKDKPVVDVYFLNINDFFTGFCLQLDENSNRVLSATGNGYTSLQTQSVNVNLDSYNGVFNATGEDSIKVMFSKEFENEFSVWTCEAFQLSSTCRHVCFGTAWISEAAVRDNSFLNDYLFLHNHYLKLNRSVSDFYQITLLNPLSGAFISLIDRPTMYSVFVPVNDYKPINYYSCFIFNNHIGWDIIHCTSSNYAKQYNDRYFIQCNCSVTGLLGVFAVNAPSPVDLPEHNNIQITMTLNTDVSSDDVSKFIARIAQLSEIDRKRFVDVINNENKIVKVTLRPPFKNEQASNSYAMQAIQRIVGHGAILGSMRVRNFTYRVIKRDLNGDSYARKITMNLVRSYLQELGDDTDEYVKKWVISISNTLRISEYRLKNAKLFFGIVFNFTITVPFSDEVKSLSAEEISVMIQECVKYEELEFALPGELIFVDKIQNSETIILKVLHETNALMIVLIIVLSTVLGVGTLFIGGAVVVKIKTDRLIEQERHRALLKEQFNLPPPPEYANSDQYLTPSNRHQRVRQESRHY